jgi:hypothetical protein
VRVARPWRWLLPLPLVALLSGPFVANRIEPFVFGVPWLLAWTVGAAITTAVTLALVYLLDRRHDAREERRPRA